MEQNVAGEKSIYLAVKYSHQNNSHTHIYSFIHSFTEEQ